jgi:hypothetical protein
MDFLLHLARAHLALRARGCGSDRMVPEGGASGVPAPPRDRRIAGWLKKQGRSMETMI